MPITYVHERHDIGILRTDGTTKVGLMLATDKNSLPKYQMFAKKKLADQFFTGVPDYGYQDPEEEVPILQDDWRSGLGLEVADKNDSKRYHKSTMDMRFRNKGLAGTKSTAIYGTAGWRSPTSATDTGAAWTNDANAYDEDTSTYAYDTVANNSWGDWLELNIASIACDSIRYYVTRASTGIDFMNLDVYYSGGWVALISGDTAPTFGAYTTVAIGSTQNVTAARIRFHTVASDDGRINDFDFNIAGNVTLGKVISSAEFNDLLYISTATELWKMNTSGNGFTYVRGFPASITSLCSFSDSRLYIALGLSNNYWYCNTSESFTVSTAVVNDFKYFVMVNAATPVLWGSDSAYTIRSNTNPINGGAAWSGQTTVDTSYYDITKLLSKSGACYIMKENRPYYLNSSGAVQDDLAPELEALKKSTDNGKNAVVWLNKIYLPWGEQALLEEDSGTNTWRSPALAATDAAEYNGLIFAIAGDDQYLYIILDNSTKVQVLASRLETIDSTTRWVQHCIAEITLTGCETAFVSSVYQKRLWISSTSASEDLYYIPLPIGYADVVNDTNRAFLTATTMETSWLHGSFPLTTKAFPELTVVMGHTYNTGRYFTVKYKKLGDSSWTTIGNYTGSATSMTQSRFIPADASSNNPKATMFKLQFTAVTDDTTITPILLNYLLKGVLYPGQRDIIACSVKCSNEITLKDGTLDKGSRDYIVATIDEAREATWPVTFYDIDGTTVTGKLLPVNPLFSITRVEKGRVIESEYNLLLQKIDLS